MKASSWGLSFAARIYLALLFVFGATLVSTGLVAWEVAGDQAMSRSERTIDQSLQNSEFDLEQEASDLSTLGKWLVNQNEFVSLARTRDGNGLARLLEPLTQTGIVDVLAVSDTSGQVTVRVRENQPITQGDIVLSQPGVIQALSGKSTTQLGQDGSGQLLGRFTLPIYDQVSQPPIGVLLIGFYLDGPFIQRMSSGLANQAVIVYDGRVAISNMAESSGGSWVGQMVPEEVARAEREGRPSGIVTFESGSTKSIFKFRPLHFPASVAAGMYGVGISSDMIEGERAELFRAMSGWILLVVII
ncbi:MAG TPA: cache domain-containing protein, partial [Anaerolineae bacterium]